MEGELAPASSAGARLVELAEQHAGDFAGTADHYDRTGSFPFPNWTAMRHSGFLAGPVPAALGGLGVTAIHDLVVAVSRLARGDGSTAIGAAMHSTAFWYLARWWSTARDDLLAARLKVLLRRCARGRAVACVAMSEAGTSLGWPHATATLRDGRYRVYGRKSFCTNSPVATVFLSSVRICPEEGTGTAAPPELGFAVIPRDTPGVEVRENWDALGMRASGSGEVVFATCEVPPSMVMASGPLGVLPADLFPLAMVGALVLAGAALGIAEQAQQIAVAQATSPRRGDDGAAPAGRHAVQVLLAENEIDLSVGRAVAARAALLLTQRLAAAGGTGPARPELHRLMKEVQCANVAMKRAAIAVVDRCLTTSGGRGYLSAHPLSRLYRDVRAGPFMQPFSLLDAFEYIGKVRLGIDTDGAL